MEVKKSPMKTKYSSMELPNSNNVLQDHNILMSHQAENDHLSDTNLKDQIMKLRRKIDELVDQNSDLLQQQAKNIEERIQLQQSVSNSESNLQAIKAQYASSIKILKDEVQHLRNTTESQMITSSQNSELQSRIIFLENEGLQHRNMISSLEDAVSRRISEINSLKESITKNLDLQNNLRESLDSSKQEIENLKTNNRKLIRDYENQEAMMKDLTDSEANAIADVERLNLTIIKQQETLNQMNQMTNQLRANIDSLKEQKDSENLRAQEFEIQLNQVTNLLSLSEQQNKKLELEKDKLIQEKHNLITELKHSQSYVLEARENKMNTSSKIDQLEKDNVALVMTQMKLSKENDLLKDNLSVITRQYNEEKEKYEREHRLASNYVIEVNALKTEIKKSLEEQQVQDDHIDELSRQLGELETLHRRSLDKQKDRIDEYEASILAENNKNNELVDTVNQLQSEVKALTESQKSLQIQLEREKNDFKEQNSLSRQKLSGYEDEIEILTEKLESSKGEIDELKHVLQNYDQQQNEILMKLNEKHLKNIEDVRNEILSSLDQQIIMNKGHMRNEAKNEFDRALKQMETNYEEKLTKASFEFNIVSEELVRAKRLSEDTQSQLSNEKQVTTNLNLQIREMRKFHEETLKHLQDKITSLESEKVSVDSKYSVDVQDLREQIKTLSQSINQKDVFISTMQEQLRAEQQMRIELSKVRLDEQESQIKIKTNDERLQLEVDSLKSINDDLMKQVEMLKAERELKTAEIEKLLKRDELLSLAIVKLSTTGYNPKTTAKESENSHQTADSNASSNSMNHVPKEPVNLSVNSPTDDSTLSRIQKMEMELNKRKKLSSKASIDENDQQDSRKNSESSSLPQKFRDTVKNSKDYSETFIISKPNEDNLSSWDNI